MAAGAHDPKENPLLNDTRPDRSIRREADLIELSVGRGRFRRRRRLDQSAATEELVLRAVERAQEGDADALRFLYLRYADHVYGYVCAILRDEHEAEDVIPQVFAKLLGPRGSFQPRSVPFSAWILGFAPNARVRHMRPIGPTPVARTWS